MNRLWQHHFGSGIVATVENFGRSGALPTHPGAARLAGPPTRAGGLELQGDSPAGHDLGTYRQSSRVTPEAEKRDPGNVLLSRMPLARVDAEALRDSILFIAGRLDETCYGPPELLFVRHDGMVMTPDSSATQRRSIYLAATPRDRSHHAGPVRLSTDGPQLFPAAEHGGCAAGAVPV